MRLSGPTIAALVCAALVGLLYVSPVLRDVARTGLDWPIWIEHPEGLIHTNYGKWWVLPPHRYLVDGNSGEFPIYYPSLSDSMINVVAEGLRVPAMTVQAVLFGPFLGSAFLLLNYFSLAAVLGDRRVALVASLILSLGGNSSFVDRLDPASGLPLNAVLHVPFHVISLATSQSLGWVLLLPTLSLSYLAYREFSWTRAVGAGVLLGALFHSHTLTFVNVAAAQLAFLVLRNALDRRRDARYKAWLAALGLIAALFVGLVATRDDAVVHDARRARRAGARRDLPRRPEQALLPLELWGRRARRAAVRAGAGETRGAARRDAGRLESGSDDDGRPRGLPVVLRGVPAGRGARLALCARPIGVRLGLGRSSAATAFLAVNHLWDWGNHPYRYAIHLHLPLDHPGQPRPARRAAAARRNPGRLARRGVPAERVELRVRPARDGALPRGRAGAGAVPRDRSGDHGPGGGPGPAPAPPGRAHLPARPRAGHHADELLADPGVHPRLPPRAVARAIPQPHGPLLLPVPGLPEPGLSLRLACLRRGSRPGPRARDDPRPAAEDRGAAALPHRLRGRARRSRSRIT